MTTKIIDSKGRLALGSDFAGRLVIVDDADPDKIIVTLARAIPEKEAWLYQNEEALRRVRRAWPRPANGVSARRRPTLMARPLWSPNSKISDLLCSRSIGRAFGHTAPPVVDDEGSIHAGAITKACLGLGSRCQAFACSPDVDRAPRTRWRRRPPASRRS